MINWNYFNYYKINFTLNRFVKTFSHQFNYILSPNRKFSEWNKKIKNRWKKTERNITQLSRNAIIFVIMAVTWQGMMNGLQLLIYGVSALDWNASFYLREWKRFSLYGIQYAQTALETFRLSIVSQHSVAPTANAFYSTEISHCSTHSVIYAII